MSLSRRRFLGVVGAGALTAGLTGCGGAGSGQTAELLRSRIPLPRKFAVPLPIPPEKQPTRSDALADHYDIVQRVREVEIVPGYRTPIFGYDGMFPGPTIRSRSGRTAVVTHRNELPVPTVVHLHGGHTPARHDGYPVDLLYPTGWNDVGHEHAGTVAGTRRGSRDYVYTARAARRHALVPRPPDGLHRTAGVARAGWLPSHRRRRDRRAAAAAR